MKNNLPVLLNEFKISKWVYEYCMNINDNPEVLKRLEDIEF